MIAFPSQFTLWGSSGADAADPDKVGDCLRYRRDTPGKNKMLHALRGYDDDRRQQLRLITWKEDWGKEVKKERVCIGT